jgi:LysM repeat protein
LRIYAGSQTVEIPSAKGKSAENRRQGLENVSTRKSDAPESLEHRVKPGETLYSIAHEYQTSVSAIRQSNPFLAERPLQAGDVLTIQR